MFSCSMTTQLFRDRYSNYLLNQVHSGVITRRSDLKSTKLQAYSEKKFRRKRSKVQICESQSDFEFDYWGNQRWNGLYTKGYEFLSNPVSVMTAHSSSQGRCIAAPRWKSMQGTAAISYIRSNLGRAPSLLLDLG